MALCSYHIPVCAYSDLNIYNFEGRSKLLDQPTHMYLFNTFSVNIGKSRDYNLGRAKRF